MTQIVTAFGRIATLTRPARRALGLDDFYSLWRQRRALARLDDRALADIGLTRAQAQAEAARPLWDVPATWRD